MKVKLLTPHWNVDPQWRKKGLLHYYFGFHSFEYAGKKSYHLHFLFLFITLFERDLINGFFAIPLWAHWHIFWHNSRGRCGLSLASRIHFTFRFFYHDLFNKKVEPQHNLTRWKLFREDLSYIWK